MQPTTIGIDIAKSVFQLHGVDASGIVVLSRRLGRGQMIKVFAKLSPCLVGMEACATAHHWARELNRLGHTVRLMPPSYVKAYVKRSKNDAADAAAICEAVTRPSMRFVAVKSVDQQAALMLHRARDLLIRQRTQLANALRAHLAELGLVAPKGREGLAELVDLVTEGSAEGGLPPTALFTLQTIIDQLSALKQQLAKLDRAMHTQHRASETSRRLESVPGIGVIGASALTATITDPSVFHSPRDLAAWIGLVPRQNSSGGKERLGRITKQGDRYLRRLLIVGASAVIQQARRHPERNLWLMRLLARKPAKVAAVALANKMARIVWVLMTRGGTYRAPALAAAA
jgi:transposase